MSMVLYALSLHPFYAFLNRKMPRIKTGNRIHTAVGDDTGDVTIFFTAAVDFAITEEAINLFELASGAKLNPRKFKALATGGCNTPETIRGIKFYKPITILGVTFWGTARPTVEDTWARLTGNSACKQRKRMTGMIYCTQNAL